MTRGRAIAAVVIALLVTLVLVFDWNWFREPLQNYVTRKTDREFRISDLDVRLGFTPTILLKDVYFANPPWAEGDAMAQVGAVDVSVSLRSLLAGEIYVPRLALTDADVRLEQMVDDRKNWTLSDRDDPSSTKVRIGSISVTRGNLRFVDHGMPLQLKVAVDTVDPTTPQKAVDGSVRPDSQRLTTRFVFDGKYHDAKFSGNALTGDVVSFQQTGVLFPIRGHLKAGTTTLDVDGTVADVTDISAIDVHLRIAGQTLANLYPFLLLPLPASPPYRLEGNLKLSGNRFAMDKIRGKIGETDVSGSGSYVRQEPRPLLEAKLHSQLLNIADLGPLVGVTTKSSTTTAPATQAETATEDRAKAKERASSGDRVLPAGTPPGERLLPTGKFEGGRLKAIDAKADFSVDKVKVPGYVDVNDLRVGLRLKDGVLKLDPFDATVAGGKLVSKITLDATGKTLLADIDVEARRFKLGALLPSSDRIAEAEGLVGGRAILKGAGNSVADAAARSDGEITVLVSKGEVSNLLDAVSGLNGGKIIKLMIGGDKTIPIRCGVIAFDVKEGQGTSKAMVVDTEQTRIEGAGGFDLGNERFDLRIAPKPKNPGILSLRTPVRLHGTFRDPDYQLEKKNLVLRVGGAVALAFIAPIAALLPLIETGPGSDAACGQLLDAAKEPAPEPGSKP